MLAVVFRSTVKAIAPLATAAAAAVVAWALLKGPVVWVPVSIVLGLVTMFTAAAFEIGEGTLPKDPERGLKLMELHKLTYWVISVLGAALVVRVGLLFPDDLKGDTKALIATISAGATAFVTASFASISGDKADETLAKQFQAAFRRRFVFEASDTDRADGTAYFSEDHPDRVLAEQYVFAERYEGISGWDRENRMRRAEGLAEILKTHPSSPPPTGATG